MADDLLASVADLAALLKQPIPADDPGATLLMTMASEIVRNEARQHFTLVTDDVVKLTGGRRELPLPERPAISVSKVVGLYYATTADPFYYDIPDAAALYGPLPPGIWVLDAQGRLLLPRGSIWPPVVEVTYTHGYDTVPNDVRAVVLNAARRQWANPTGSISHTLGSLNVQYGQVRSGPNAGIADITLNANERRILAKYRRGTFGGGGEIR